MRIRKRAAWRKKLLKSSSEFSAIQEDSLLRLRASSYVSRLILLQGFRLCGGDQRAFRSPFGNLRRRHFWGFSYFACP